KEMAGLPQSIRTVRFRSLRHIYEMTTANIWLDNNRVCQYLFKRAGQYYIQTWHGGLGLKKIEGDAPYGVNARHIKFSKRDSKMTDLYISNSKHLSDIYKRAFWFDGDILESGYPKNDILFEGKDTYQDKVRNKFGVHKKEKILLYAPTFRENGAIDAYDIDFNLLHDALNKIDKWTIFIRLHPNVELTNF